MFSVQIITHAVIGAAHFPRSVPEPTARPFLRGYGFCIAMMPTCCSGVKERERAV